MRLVLASASPRRRELLAAAGLPAVVDPVSLDESALPDEAPDRYVERLAMAKAREGLARHPDAAVLGADTTVVLDGSMLGKPATDAEAAAMLRRLSGRSHEVLTAVVIATARDTRARVERTTVFMTPISDAEIAWYVESGEPRDKAGGYAIQGLASRFVPRIDGSYSNVVGLPVAVVLQLLKEMGLEAALGSPWRGPNRREGG